MKLHKIQSNVCYLLDVKDNSKLIQEGDEIIQKYLRETFKNYPEEIAESIIGHLISTSMLAHVATHIGLKDIILTKVSIA